MFDVINMTDYQRWNKRDLWTVGEAVCLLIGTEPDSYNHGGYDFGYRIPHALQEKYNETICIVEQALEIGSLKLFNDDDASRLSLEFMRVHPREFITWADDKGYAVHEELIRLNAKSRNNVDLDPRERKSMLQIIAALSKEVKLDLDKPFKSAESILVMGAIHCVVLPNKPDTIKKFLSEASSLLKSQ